MAIVHDYLNQRGGGERVVLEMAGIWPEAPIYTSLYRPESTFPEFATREIRTSVLDRLPVDRRFRALAPFYPAAFRSLGVLSEPLVLSSSSGWAHGVRTGPRSTHVVYCHNPARWIYQAGEYLPGSPTRTAFRPLSRLLRRWDQRAARRPDAYIATGEVVRRRLRAVYGHDAAVVHPPVDTERFEPRPRGERLLVVSRLLPYKRVDLIVAAATRAGIGLDVVGTGPSLEKLRARAGPSVAFHGRLDDAAVTGLMGDCRALCLPAAEDFGIVPVEANAAGKPVVAFAAGGVLETQLEGVTAAFFREQTEDDVLEAIRRVEEISTSPEALAEAAERFSRAAFRSNLLAEVGRVLEARGAG